MKAWHISDTHFSFDANWQPIKPMHLRKWAIGVWTYQGYLEKMVKFSNDNIADEDFVFITGDFVHDMRDDVVEHSFRWLRQNIKGTIIVCRGNHDVYWQPAKMRQRVSDLPRLYILDEGEIISIGPFTIGCFSNHASKTQDFSYVDGRYLETALRTTRQASEKGLIPVMMSHYPVNLEAAKAIGKTGLKAFLSGHIHITAGNDPNAHEGLNWDWYNKSAAQTDDLTIEGCFYSTATTDTVLVKHGQSFKELTCLEVKDKNPKIVPADELIILCGIPGSGKSTVAEVLRERYDFVRVNQDDLGSKRRCIAVTEAALKNGKSVVVDRCNFDSSQRKTWIDLAKFYKVKNLRAVELIVPLETCIARAGERQNHPTIQGMTAAENVCKALSPLYVSPQQVEGLHQVVRIDAADKNVDLIVDIIRNPEKYK